MEEIFNIFLNLMLVVRRLATPENADKTLIAISKQKYIRKTTTLAKKRESSLIPSKELQTVMKQL